MSLKLSLGAEEDAKSAVQWYERQRLGLGTEFLGALERLLESIEAHPNRFPPFELPNFGADLRQAILRRFPYRVIFEIPNEEDIWVLAVAHSSRRPDYWISRLN